jgi:hypothetical protein
MPTRSQPVPLMLLPAAMKRVSASENGSFQAFLQETRWRRVVLSGGLLGGK